MDPVTLGDLPEDVLHYIAELSRPVQGWRPVLEVVRATANLAATGKAAQPLVAHMYAMLKGVKPFANKRLAHIPVTFLLEDVDEQSRVVDLRRALRARGLRVSGSKATILERLTTDVLDKRPLTLAFPTLPICLLDKTWLDAAVSSDDAETFGLEAADFDGEYMMSAARLRDVVHRKYPMAHQFHAGVTRMIEQKRAKLAKVVERREKLRSALADAGCALRSDSKLCATYIHGLGSRTLEQVVDELVEMKFFRQHTRYAALMGTMLNRHGNGRPGDEYESEEYDYSGRYYDPLDASRAAKSLALSYTVRQYGLEGALAISPASLHTRIRHHF